MGSIFRINSNLAATFAQRQLSLTSRNLNKANERLASGKRINTAADDPAGLAQAEKLEQGLRGLKTAERNAQDGISVLETAEGGLSSINDKLQRVRELAVQAANDSLTDDDREQLQTELDQLVDEIDRSTSTVQFNGMQLLKNQFAGIKSSGKVDTSTIRGSLEFHVGANRDETITVTAGTDIVTTTGASLDVRVDSTGAGTGSGDPIKITSQALAESAIEIATDAIDSVTESRANVGAVLNRLQSTVDFLQIQQENTKASESRIRDADIAEESVKRTRASILSQAGTAVLAQAQQNSQLALQLL